MPLEICEKGSPLMDSPFCLPHDFEIEKRDAM